MKKYILLIIIVIIISISSCKKDNRLVIIDRLPYPAAIIDGDTCYTYKVYRIHNHTVDYVEIDFPFEVGDTIIFQYHYSY
jgi:hypothetical protein